MANALTLQPGETFTLTFTIWQDTANTMPTSLVGATLSFQDAWPNVLESAGLVIADAPNGRIDMTVPVSVCDYLRSDHLNWFRVEADYGASNIVTPNIYIKISGDKSTLEIYADDGTVTIQASSVPNDTIVQVGTGATVITLSSYDRTLMAVPTMPQTEGQFYEALGGWMENGVLQTASGGLEIDTGTNVREVPYGTLPPA